MRLENSHIDFNRIKDYFNGKLSPEEMHALEMEAQNDPFLYEAMEGYEAHPGGIDQISKLKKNQAKSSRSFFGSGTLSVIGIAGLVYIIALIISPEIDENTDQPEVKITEEIEEVEVIPESIDTFVYAEIKDQITPKEITDNRPLIEESNVDLAVILEEAKPEIIQIDEAYKIENEDEIIPENETIKTSVYAPHIYQYEMKVIDYRDIKRENKVINYTRYELSGLPAEFEDAESRDELKETEVEVPYMEYLEKSMYYFSKGQFKKALTRYVTILDQYPKDLNAHFYGALCYYDMKQYDKALILFTAMQEYEFEEGFIAFRQEAKWYQAKTLVKLKRKNEATKILDDIISEGLFYSADAIKLKSSL